MPNALAVVAHHDDHVLWMGGTIRRLTDLGWNWLLVAMCVEDAAKQAYFRECAAAYNQEFCMMTFADYQEGGVFSRNQRAQMAMELATAVSGSHFHVLFTHSRDAARGEGGNANGEYGGHANHTEVRQVVTDLVASGQIACPRDAVAQFAYSAIYVTAGTPTCARTDSTCFMRLTYDELAEKSRLCALAPDVESSLRALEYPCPNPEGFEGESLRLPESVFIRRESNA